MTDKIKVLIVEDDFRVANINRDYVVKVDGFEVVHIAKTAQETQAYLESTSTFPHLILLDVYIPDDEELTLFRTLRRNFPTIDIIMLTAANEVATIKAAFHGGVFDYLVKPVEFSRFEKSLLKYQEQFRTLRTHSELNQTAIDRLKGFQVGIPQEGTAQLPKGIDEITLQKIVKVLSESTAEGVTALFAGKQVGVSRSTARRYLEYLVSIKEAQAQLKYGAVGRPERRYTQ